MQENNNNNQLNIELSEEVAEGIYSNLAIITHSNSEFVVDFVKVMPGVPKAKVKARILLTPQHAKRLLNALADGDAAGVYLWNATFCVLKWLRLCFNPMFLELA